MSLVEKVEELLIILRLLYLICKFDVKDAFICNSLEKSAFFEYNILICNCKIDCG